MLRLLVGAFLLCSVSGAEARNSRALEIGPVVFDLPKKPVQEGPIAINPGFERAGDRNQGLGNVAIGSTGTLTTAWTITGSSTTAKMTFAATTLTGSAGYKIIKDGCKGVTVVAGQSCPVEVSYNFTASGMQNVILNTPWTVEDTGTNPPTTYSGTATKSYSAYVVPAAPEYEENPAPQNCQGESPGSIVRLDSQSLGEEISIVGTGLYLAYTSENSKQFVTNAPKANRIANFNPEGMSVSVLHYYDRVKLRIFEGTGTSRFAKYINLEGQRVVASSNAEELYYFDSNGRHMTTRNALTGAILRTFNYSNNKLSSIVDAYGNTTKFNRSSTGVLTSITAPFGQNTIITTDSAGLITSVKNPLGQTYTLAYKTGTDLLEKFTKPGGQYSTFSYDVNGKLTKDAASGGNRWDLLLTLMSDQRVVDQSSALARKNTYYFWGEKGDSHRYIDHASGAWSDSVSLYNNGGNIYYEEGSTEKVVSLPDMRLDVLADTPIFHLKQWLDEETNNLPYVMTSFHRSVNDSVGLFSFGTIVDSATVNDRTISTTKYTAGTKTYLTTSNQGATSTKVIDQFGKTSSFKTGNDTPWAYNYDGFGRLASKSQGAYNSEKYLYDSNGYLQSVTNARNEVTSYSYDLAGRLTQIKLPDNRLIGMTYDANGNKTGIIPPSKPLHKFVFNAMELMSSYQPPALTGVSVKDTTYTYNQDKQLTQITRPDTRTVKYIYETNTNRLAQVQVARGVDEYIYRVGSDRIALIDSADGIRSVYKYFGKSLKSEEQRLVSNDAFLASVQYLYDNEFRVSARVLKGNGYTSTIGITYNGDSVPTKIGNLNLTYSYPSGRLATTALDRITDSRTYDSLGNLKSYSAIYTPTTGSASTLYSYSLTRDAASRITGKTETIGGVTSSYVYKYDVAGRLISVTKDGATNSTFSYDANGNKTGGTINGVAFTATYDDQDRLATWNSAVYSYNANGDNTGIQNGTVANTYTYDAFSRLLASVVPSSNYKYQYDGKGRQVRVYSATTGATVMRRIYEDDLRIAAEYNDAGVITKEYVYGTSANSPDYAIISGVRYRFIKDHLGSPRLIVKSSDGTIAQRMDYSVFGQVTNNTKPGFQAYGFAGGLLISSVGLTKFGARWYDSNTGRWTTKDPVRFDGGDTNLFGYVANDPINGIDQLGLGTLQVGIAFNYHFAGFNGQGGFGIAFDTHGGIGGYTYEGGGIGAGATTGFGGSIQTSNADNICDLRGNFANSSVHGGGGLGGALDIFSGHAPNGSEINGAGITFGAQEGGSISTGITNTQITPWRFH